MQVYILSLKKTDLQDSSFRMHPCTAVEHGHLGGRWVVYEENAAIRHTTESVQITIPGPVNSGQITSDSI